MRPKQRSEGGTEKATDQSRSKPVAIAQEFCRDQLASGIHRIEAELRRLRGSATDSCHKTAADLCDLERQAIELACQAADRESSEAGLNRRAILDELTRWSKLAESLDLGSAALAAANAARHLLQQEICDWQKTANSLTHAAAPDVCFNALLHTTVLELEAGAVFRHNPCDLTGLADLRNQLRDRLIEAVGRDDADVVKRNEWATRLLDRSNIVLRAIDNLPPQEASEHLRLSSDDLRWYAQHIETRRNPLRRQLQRKRSQLRSEYEERTLQTRLEDRFGHRAVVWFEQGILLLIALVVVLLGVETFYELSPEELFWLHVTDTVACVVFLWEFAIKWWLVPDRWRWFWRHLAIDLIPSIPFGLFLGVYAADSVRIGRLGRLLRLPRLARYVRVLRPAVRLLRAVGFLIRGFDRLARMYGQIINRDIILYPTRAERQQCQPRELGAISQLPMLLAAIDEHWRTLLLETAPDDRIDVSLARTRLLSSIPDTQSLTLRASTAPEILPSRAVLFETLWRQLVTLTPQHLKSVLTPDLTARLARITRLFAHPPVCWFPILRKYVPRISPHMPDLEVVAAAARRLASAFKQYHDRSLWLTDFYGTITPPQFIDRVGVILVKNSARPAYRLALFGSFFLLTELLLHVMNVRILAPAEAFLDRFIGPTLIVLGSLCLMILAVGWWLQQLAREATDFLEKSIEAQFLPLTELIRAERLERDATVLDCRVLRPERLIEQTDDEPADRANDLIGRVRLSLAGTYRSSGTGKAFDVVERVVLLHRDSLDGALLCLSDNRTTNQLLGSPALRQLERQSWRVGRREVAQLRRLDLDRQQSLVGGPYVWFNLIARSIAQGAARLMLDYNRHAIPLEELSLASPYDQARYRRWLEATKSAKIADAGQLKRSEYATNAFTALHFLDCQPERDANVSKRFGPAALQRLQRDRSLLFRRVFGTYPFHRWSKEKRCINLYSLYQRWLAGGRVLLLPCSLLLLSIQRCARLLAWIVQAVQEIRYPERRSFPADAASVDFASAIRKIDRMRGPVVYASLQLRSWIDPEYLGIPIPGQDCSTPKGCETDLEADLRFLDPDPSIIDRLNMQRRRAEADMRRWQCLIDSGLLERVAARLQASKQEGLSPERLRAAAVVYLADIRGVRSHLSATEILKEVYEAAPLAPRFPARLWPCLKRRWMFRRYWKKRGTGGRDTRLAAWRATTHNHWGVADALTVWNQNAEKAPDQGERILAELLRYPERISEQLAMLRAVQTLAILDVLNYREHVYKMGDYAADSDGDGKQLDTQLKWDAVPLGTQPVHRPLQNGFAEPNETA